MFVDCKQEKDAIKIELEEEEENSTRSQPPRKKARMEKIREVVSSKEKYIDKDLDVLMDKTIISEDNEVVKLHDDEKKKNKIHSYRVILILCFIVIHINSILPPLRMIVGTLGRV